MPEKPVSALENQPIDLADLSGQQLFHQVNLVGLESLLKDCPSLALREGASLIEPGQVNQLLYLVLLGTLHVYEGEPTGQPLAVIGKGECIGLMSLIDQQPCHVHVVAKGTCRVLVIDEERFLALINSSNAIARNLFSMVMQYLRGKNAAIAPERARLQQRMEQHSHIDPVTGLYNERWLDSVLERQIMRSAKDEKPLSVLAIGIQAFAEFKNEFGSEVADFALALAGQVIAGHVRPTDMVARLGLDHFLVVLPETEITSAGLVERRIREAVANTAIEIPNACRLPPLKIITGKVQMKTVVAARQLVEEALDNLAAAPRLVAGD